MLQEEVKRAGSDTRQDTDVKVLASKLKITAKEVVKPKSKRKAADVSTFLDPTAKALAVAVATRPKTKQKKESAKV
jgi:hypothetical protein